MQPKIFDMIANHKTVWETLSQDEIDNDGNALIPICFKDLHAEPEYDLTGLENYTDETDGIVGELKMIDPHPCGNDFKSY